MPLRNKVKRFVEAREPSVYKFRKKAGLAQETAYKLYKDSNHLPSPRTLEKICDAYRVQPSELLEWVDM